VFGGVRECGFEREGVQRLSSYVGQMASSELSIHEPSGRATARVSSLLDGTSHRNGIQLRTALSTPREEGG